MNDPLILTLRAKLEDIAQTLATAKANGQVLNEAQTELVIIDPLLHTLGYHPLEYGKQSHNKVTGGIPDYTPLPDTAYTWFLEGKAIDFPLSDKEAAQAVSYAFHNGRQWAVLTNGRTWFIYDAHLQKPLNEKRVFQIEDVFASPEAAQTLALLSRASMTSSGLITALALQQLDLIVRREWKTPGSSLRKSLQNTVRKETGGTVSDEAIGAALSALTQYSPQPAPAPLLVAPIAAAIATEQSPPAGNWQTLEQFSPDATSITGRKPARLCLNNGPAINVKSWADVARAVVEWLASAFSLPSLPFALGIKSKKYLLNTKPVRADGKPMITHVTVNTAGQSLFVDMNRSAHDTVNALLALMEIVGAPAQSVWIELQEPETKQAIASTRLKPRAHRTKPTGVG